MSEGDTSVLHLYWEFANSAQAEQVKSQMTGQHLHGYNTAITRL